MSIFPGISELILAVFTALLSLAVSLFLLKIQTTNIKSIKQLKNDQRIIIARQSETEELIRSKLTTSQESQDALGFIEKESLKALSKISEDLTVLEGQKKKTNLITVLGLLLMAVTSRFNIYFLSVILKNGGRMKLSELIVFSFLNIFFLIYFWYGWKLAKKFVKDFSALKERLTYLSNEIARAHKIALKGIK